LNIYKEKRLSELDFENIMDKNLNDLILKSSNYVIKKVKNE